MSSSKLTKTQQVELECIRHDAEFLVELMLQLNKHQSSGILAPSIVPYFSLFAIESYKYFQEFFPSHGLSLSTTFEPIIRESRLRIKFFEAKKPKVKGVFDLLDWISAFHTEWHVNKHKGPLSPLKKALQDDLGIFFYDGHIIGSTHTGILNVGYREDDLPANSDAISPTIQHLSHSLGRELGGYAVRVLSLPEIASISQSSGHFNYTILDQLLGYQDEKAKKFLTQVFNGSSHEAVNLTLLAFLAQVNFLLYILRSLMATAPYSLFKLQYIVMYHLNFSLKRLQDYSHHLGLLTEHSKKYLQAVIKDKELKQLTKEEKLRNILVHYTLYDVPESELYPTRELYGLVEHSFNGKSYPEVSNLVEKQLRRISAILEEWLNWQVEPYQIRSWW